MNKNRIAASLNKINMMLIIIFMTLASCSDDSEKIKLLESSLDINLRNNYEIIDDAYLSREGFLESDYSIKLTLKLSENDLNQIVHEIKRHPFYNELGKYRNRSNGEREV